MKDYLVWSLRQHYEFISKYLMRLTQYDFDKFTNMCWILYHTPKRQRQMLERKNSLYRMSFHKKCWLQAISSQFFWISKLCKHVHCADVFLKKNKIVVWKWTLLCSNFLIFFLSNYASKYELRKQYDVFANGYCDAHFIGGWVQKFIRSIMLAATTYHLCSHEYGIHIKWLEVNK